MTGPLQLPGDPVAPNQAATKHYVDSGLAVKADVIGGVVPSGQLGNGTANISLCLHGDSSWGACGGSSNAVSIQNVPVGYDGAGRQPGHYLRCLGGNIPAAGGQRSDSGNGGGEIFTGLQLVAVTIDQPEPAPGAKTVNLSACVAGVVAAEPQYYVYVAGTGTAEAVLVTGGTCNGDGQPGRVKLVEDRVNQLEKRKFAVEFMTGL